MDKEHYRALHRMAAEEAVPYTKDYPEQLLVLPEITDGSISHGKATRVEIDIKLNKEGPSSAQYKDDGRGLWNELRFKTFASAKSETVAHRNGHGMKKYIAKWMPNYDQATWWVLSRKKNRDPIKYSSPYLGDRTQYEEFPDDNTSFMPNGSGMEFGHYFNLSILAHSKWKKQPPTAQQLTDTIREILETRYDEKVLRSVQFILRIEDSTGAVVMDSHERGNEWHSFEWWVADMAKKHPELVRLVHQKTVDLIPARSEVTYISYLLLHDGKLQTPLSKRFPTYGKKNMACARIHIPIQGRTIAAIPVSSIRELAEHNSGNGVIAFLKCVALDEDDIDCLPAPCTTKVSFQETDPVFIELLKIYTALQSEPALPVPKPTDESEPKPKKKKFELKKKSEPSSQAAGTTSSAQNEIQPAPAGGSAATQTPAPKPPKPAVELLREWEISISLTTTGSLNILGKGKKKTLTLTIESSNAAERDTLIFRGAQCENADKCWKWLKAYIDHTPVKPKSV